MANNDDGTTDKSIESSELLQPAFGDRPSIKSGAETGVTLNSGLVIELINESRTRTSQADSLRFQVDEHADVLPTLLPEDGVSPDSLNERGALSIEHTAYGQARPAGPIRDDSTLLETQHSTSISEHASSDDGDGLTLGSTVLVMDDRADEHPKLLTSRYEDRGVLGRGGMGTVHRIRDRLLNRTLAMKILHTDLVDKDVVLERFVQEAQVCAQLEHPNILPIHDLGVLDEGNLFITMTEIRGASFDKYIRRVHAVTEIGSWNEGVNGWNFFRLVGVFLDVCKAMAYAHERNVVHRDLKPQNIMVCEQAEVLVVDWGLAKIIGENQVDEPIVTTRSNSDANATAMGMIYGTPAYMAPELTKSESKGANVKSDIYALGAILYEVLRGHQAYSGASAYEILVKVAIEPPRAFTALLPTEYPTAMDGLSEPVEDDAYITGKGAPLPHALVEICERAMARSPEARFDSVHEMVDAIGQWLDGSRRREEALAKVASGQALNATIERTESKITQVMNSVHQMQKLIEPWAPESKKREIWALEDWARTLEEELISARIQQGQLYRLALAHKDDLPEAHAELAIHYRRIHQGAEADGDMEEVRRADAILREHAAALPVHSELRRSTFAYLEGRGTLSLQTTPSGARAQLVALVHRDRRLMNGPTLDIGVSPIHDYPIEIGSYAVRIELSGHHDVIYPVANRRLDVIDGFGPTGQQEPIRLLPLGTLGADDCYVPAGYCWVGGDPNTPNCGPRQRVWIDGFVIRRFPVTHREYLGFLNDLMATGREAEALMHVPREQSSTDEELGAMAYRQRPDGVFALPTDPDRDICWPNQPVTMIQWASARAYATWMTEQSGRPWRLPMEYEWEKAARGVDGRFYPWGDDFDPSWACIKDSHRDAVSIQLVDTFPNDVSVYGVRGMAGNTRDWCLDRFREDGPPLKDQRLVMPTKDDLRDTGFKSTRGGSYGNSAYRARSADRDWWFPDRSYVGRGFRIAWGLADDQMLA